MVPVPPPTPASQVSPGKPVLSTIWAHDDATWERLVEVIDWREHPLLLGWLRAFLRSARGREAVVLRGTVTWRERYRDLIGAVALKLRGRPPLVVISDATIEPGSRALAARLGLLGRLLPALSRLLIRAVDGPHVRWCVLSQAEVERFSSTWGVPGERVVFTAFTHTLPGAVDIEAIDVAAAVRIDAAAPDGPYLFAGGNSLRDYDLLAAAAEGTGLRVVVASSWRPARPVPEIAAGYVSHEEFMHLMQHCVAGVVPIAESSRSAGQQTYLNSMALGKPTIVTDAMGVRDYIDDGRTGVVVEPTVEALRAAMLGLADDEALERRVAMGEAARDAVVALFTPTAYRRRLLEVALPAQALDLPSDSV